MKATISTEILPHIAICPCVCKIVCVSTQKDEYIFQQSLSLTLDTSESTMIEELERMPLLASDEDHGGEIDDEKQTGIITKTRPKTKKPSLYKVLLLNDDYTPMEFVVYVLEKYFNKGHEDATRIMLQVHQQGVGICGVYTYEVAETKVTQVIDFSRQHGHPLQCTMEKE